MTNTDPPRSEGASLVPGTVVARRYRLVTMRGSAPRLQFWEAIDVPSGHHVALTLVDTAGVMPVEQVNEVLSRTSRLRGMHVVGIARVLDVVHTGAFGVVACEWVHGGSLREVVGTSPSPLAAAAAMESLIVAADSGHRAGLVLGIDHPDRIRISTDGHAVLAFPATMPDATRDEDLRGIGGVLYALLVDRWPPQDPMPDGWTAADLTPAGWPTEPAEIDHGIPFLISSAAAGLLRPGSGIGSAGDVLGMLRQGRAAAEPQYPGDGPVGPPTMEPRPGGYAGFRNVDTAEREVQARRKLMTAVLVGAAVMFVIAVASLGVSINRMLGGPDDIAINADRLGLVPTTPADAPPVAREAAAAEAPITPASAAVFSPDGSPDNPGAAGQAVDGDPATAWATDRYFDADPFPAFKQGVGLLLEMPRPANLAALTIDVKGSGTVVEIRSADGQPGSVADTRKLVDATTLQPGSNRIPVSTDPQVSTVLVWITKLGSTDGDNVAEISEIKAFTTAPA